MDEPVQMPSEPPAEAAQKAKPAPPPGSLWRTDVTATVEEGLGYFLQRVSVQDIAITTIECSSHFGHFRPRWVSSRW